MKTQFFLTLIFSMISYFVLGQEKVKTYLYVGSYTGGQPSEGIYVYDFDTETGRLTEIERKDKLVNPSFLCISPNGQFLYACTESKLPQHGNVSSFRIDRSTGKISFLNKQTTKARNPAHLSVSPNSKHVVASNYTEASVSTFECAADGSLQPIAQFFEFEGSSSVKGRQDKAHLHSSFFSNDGKFVVSPDLGSDKLRVFSYTEDELLVAREDLTISTKEGSGPRHLVFHPNQPFVYSIEELSGSVAYYQYKNGKLKWKQSYPSYEREYEIYASADIHISPDGKFLYASNRKSENSISIFKIHPKKGSLSLIGHSSTFGEIPRSFVIDPTGDFLIVANKISNNLVVFKRDQNTGLLSKIDEIKGIGSPSSLKMISYDKQ
ncbi:lactonase family protein [Flammeovirga pacifica]|nr:lactonase family protein [Flammeovirga pacifica]